MIPGSPPIAVCDPNEISRIGIVAALREHGLNISGATGTREDAISLIARRTAVAMLVDIALAPAPGAALEVIGLARNAGLAVIAIGAEGSPDHVFPALRAGAVGYLTKEMPGRAWAESIAAALRGEAPLSRELTARLVEEFRSQAQGQPEAALLPSDRRLTKREWEVLEHVSTGLTNRQVSQQLQISVETVRTHVSNILAKLEAPNRSAAAARYRTLSAHAV